MDFFSNSSNQQFYQQQPTNFNTQPITQQFSNNFNSFQPQQDFLDFTTPNSFNNSNQNENNFQNQNNHMNSNDIHNLFNIHINQPKIAPLGQTSHEKDEGTIDSFIRFEQFGTGHLPFEGVISEQELEELEKQTHENIKKDYEKKHPPKPVLKQFSSVDASSPRKQRLQTEPIMVMSMNDPQKAIIIGNETKEEKTTNNRKLLSDGLSNEDLVVDIDADTMKKYLSSTPNSSSESFSLQTSQNSQFSFQNTSKTETKKVLSPFQMMSKKNRNQSEEINNSISSLDTKSENSSVFGTERIQQNLNNSTTFNSNTPNQTQQEFNSFDAFSQNEQKSNDFPTFSSFGDQKHPKEEKPNNSHDLFSIQQNPPKTNDFPTFSSFGEKKQPKEETKQEFHSFDAFQQQEQKSNSSNDFPTFSSFGDQQEPKQKTEEKKQNSQDLFANDLNAEKQEFHSFDGFQQNPPKSNEFPTFSSFGENQKEEKQQPQNTENSNSSQKKETEKQNQSLHDLFSFSSNTEKSSTKQHN